MSISKLERTLRKGEFAVTTELAPPKGTNFDRIIKIAGELNDYVDAFNVTDFQSASVKASSLGLSIDLIQHGYQPVLQLTGRDRNRIAIQGELLTASHFGIENVLCLTGDHPLIGDNPEAKPVFELDAIALLKTAETLMKGTDLAGNELEDDHPYFYLGAAVSPMYNPLGLQLIQMRKKIKAGAKFFQTQAIFSTELIREFIHVTENYDTNILYGIIPLKSAGMARFMNKNIPGIDVPDHLIELLEKSSSPLEEGIKLAADLIVELKERKLSQGVHIMSIGAEENVLKILKEAKLI